VPKDEFWGYIGVGRYRFDIPWQMWHSIDILHGYVWILGNAGPIPGKFYIIHDDIGGNQPMF
jgi:hypothetical protein